MRTPILAAVLRSNTQAELDRLRDEHQADAERREQIRDALLRFSVPDSTQRVLELGCGTGLAAAHLRPFAVSLTGVDLSPHMLARAAARHAYSAEELRAVPNEEPGDRRAGTPDLDR